MTLGRCVRVVAASALGAVIVVSLFAVLFSLSPGLNKSWLLRYLDVTIGGAIALGVVAAAALAYFGAQPVTVTRVTRMLPKLTAGLSAFILLIRFMQGLAAQG